MDKNISILLVGNPQTTLPVIKGLLNQLGLNNIEKESDGVVALRKMNEASYGLIIAEWEVESMRGIDLLKEVRAAGHDVLFMMVAEECILQDVLEAKEAGVNNLIVKPFNAGTFKDKLTRTLGIPV